MQKIQIYGFPAEKRAQNEKLFDTDVIPYISYETAVFNELRNLIGFNGDAYIVRICHSFLTFVFESDRRQITILKIGYRIPYKWTGI